MRIERGVRRSKRVPAALQASITSLAVGSKAPGDGFADLAIQAAADAKVREDAMPLSSSCCYPRLSSSPVAAVGKYRAGHSGGRITRPPRCAVQALDTFAKEQLREVQAVLVSALEDVSR